ncbi:MAG: glycosyltransferase family 4 protein [Candidatus Nanohalobium sp.]
MDLALYHPWLKEKGGAEKVVLETAKRSEHQVTVYTLLYDRENTFSEFEEVNVQELSSGERPDSFLQKAMYGLKSLTASIPTDRHDKLLISEAGLGSLIALRNNDIPVYCYCHTPLRAALPEFKQTYRSEISTPMKPVFDIGLKIYSFLEKRAWKKFEHVLANSETTKERIIGKGLKHGDEITVLNPGADIENNETGDFRKYFLYPSRFRRYKRQHLAIDAFQEAGLEDYKLVLAGSEQEEEYVEELRQKASNLPDVEIRTDLPGDEWEELYRNSYTVLFLAEKEDWGIIPVEAGSYGKPVIAVNEGGPTESVVNDKTGFLVDADKYEIAEKMKELASNPEKAKVMGQEGLENAQQYSWKNFSEKLDEVLK